MFPKIAGHIRTYSVLATLFFVGWPLPVQSTSFDNEIDTILDGPFDGVLFLNSEADSKITDHSLQHLVQATPETFIVRNGIGSPGQPVALRIELSGAQDGQYKFVMIRGLPKNFSLSAGFTAKDAWLVSIKDVPDLKLIPAEAFVGDLNLQILLITEGNGAQIEQRVTVTFQPKQPYVPDADTSLNTSAVVKPTEEELRATQEPVFPSRISKRKISDEQEAAALRRASQMLQNSDIAAARLLYEVSATKGSAQAAFAMGQTFDPVFLKSFAIEGLKPDIEEARKWYQKAVELGSQEAGERLVSLEQQR